MFFNCVAGMCAFLDLFIRKIPELNVKVRWGINVVVGVAAVCAWWYADKPWYLVDLLVIGLVFLIVRTLLFNSYKVFILLFFCWMVADITWKFLYGDGLFGNSYLE